MGLTISPSGGGGTTLTDSASLRTALSDENGTGVALFDGATSPAFTAPKITTGINDTNANSMLAFTPTGSAVDGFTLTNAATANPATVTMAATGSDSNIRISLLPKGTGFVQVPAGVGTSVPGLSIGGDSDTGFSGSGNDIYLISGGVRSHFLTNGYMFLGSAGLIGWTSSTDAAATRDTALYRNAAGVVEVNTGTAGAFGGLKAAASTWSGNMTFATDNTYDIGASGATRPRTGYFGTSLSAPLVTTTKSGENIRMVANDAYISFYNTGNTTRTGYIQGDTTIGLGLFTNISVPITVNVGNTLACTFDTSQNVVVANQLKLNKTYTAAGTTGAQTINKQSGTVRFAAAASTLVVTNSTVATTSKILLSPQTKDVTAIDFWPTAASGSFTITANAAATAETEVYFEVRN